MPVEFWPLPQSSPGMVESIALRGGGLSLRKQRFSVQIRAADGSRCASRDPALWLREIREAYIAPWPSTRTGAKRHKTAVAEHTRRSIWQQGLVQGTWRRSVRFLSRADRGSSRRPTPARRDCPHPHPHPSPTLETNRIKWQQRSRVVWKKVSQLRSSEDTRDKSV